MDVELNEKINCRYMEICEHLSKITESREDASGILWLNLRQLAEQSDLPYKSDCMGILQRKIIGSDATLNSVIANIEQSSERKEYLIEKYQFGETVNELGECWKELIKEEKAFRLRMMYGVVHGMRTELLPFGNKVVKEWENEVLGNGMELNKDSICRNRMKRYRAYLTKLREIERFFLTAYEIIEIQKTRK